MFTHTGNDGFDAVETIAQKHREALTFAFACSDEFDQGLIKQLCRCRLQTFVVGRLLAKHAGPVQQIREIDIQGRKTIGQILRLGRQAVQQVIVDSERG